MFFVPVLSQAHAAEWQSSVEAETFARLLFLHVLLTWGAVWRGKADSTLFKCFYYYEQMSLPARWLITWLQNICWLTTSRCPRLPLATFNSEPRTKSTIPSLPRATANRMLQEMKARQDKVSAFRRLGHLHPRGAEAWPARADIDVVDFAGHQAQFGHRLHHIVAVQHHVTLIGRQSWVYSGHVAEHSQIRRSTP